MALDTLKLKLGDMLHKAIYDISPTEQYAFRSMLCLFIDCGYLELTHAQNVGVTNLIQIMEEKKVKFLGTIKNSKKMPFQIVDVCEGGKRTHNGKPIIQAYMTQSNFMARYGNIQAYTLYNGGGKFDVFMLL